MLLSQTPAEEEHFTSAETSPRVHVEEPDWLRSRVFAFKRISPCIFIELKFF